MNEQRIVRVQRYGLLTEMYALAIGRRTENGLEIARLNYEPVDEMKDPLPTTYLNPTEAQVLIDSLWDAGIRPTAGHGSAGAFSAVQHHLEDMRRISFKQLDMEKGQ